MNYSQLMRTKATRHDEIRTLDNGDKYQWNQAAFKWLKVDGAGAPAKKEDKKPAENKQEKSEKSPESRINTPETPVNQGSGQEKKSETVAPDRGKIDAKSDLPHVHITNPPKPWDPDGTKPNHASPGERKSEELKKVEAEEVKPELSPTPVQTPPNPPEDPQEPPPAAVTPNPTPPVKPGANAGKIPAISPVTPDHKKIADQVREKRLTGKNRM